MKFSRMPRGTTIALLTLHYLLLASAFRPGKKEKNAVDGQLRPRGIAAHVIKNRASFGKQDESALLQRSSDPNPTETSHKSWFERLGNAFIAVLLGIFVVVPFSIALLWVNERRNAQLEALFSQGKSEAETIEAKQADLSNYDGTLVHMNNEIAKGMDVVADARFPDIKMERGCIKLMSVVEVYQWKEHEHTDTKKDSVGGGTTSTKTYTYLKVWSSTKINSASFNKSHEHENIVQVPGLAPGTEEALNGTVKYGEPYVLPTVLVQQLNNYEDASKLAGNELRFGEYSFKEVGDYFMCPSHGGEPNIGDFRVKLQYVLDGPATILALQTKNKSIGDVHTFAPYRSIPRGLCGRLSENEMKHRRLEQAKKSGDELYEEEKCWDFGPLVCLCSCCNLVTYCFTHASTSGSFGLSLTPEIYCAWPGVKSKSECFDGVRMMGANTKWVIRLFGWLLLWVGFQMFFQPLEVFADIIPFLGPYIGSGLMYIIGFLTFLLTMAIATFIVSLAYMIYHPFAGLLLMALSAGILTFVSLHVTKSPEKKQP